MRLAWICVSFFLVSSAFGADPQGSIKTQCLQHIESTKIESTPESLKLLTALALLFQGLNIPPGDLPDAATAEKLVHENPEAFYYGYGGPVDYVKARLIAYALLMKSAQDPNFLKTQVELIAPLSVLMMLYANGQGVKRNVDLALFFAAAVGGAGGELRDRLSYLIALKEKKSTEGSPLRLCDHASSGFMEGYCAKIDLLMHEGREKHTTEALIATWSAEEKGAFENLQTIAECYIALTAPHETLLGGTGRQATILSLEQAHKKAFFDLLARLNKKKNRTFTNVDFQKADRLLNQTYKTVMTKIHKPTWALTLTQANLKKAQLQWIAYRDAWVEFVQIKYPEKSGKNHLAEGLKTFLTQKRTGALKKLLHALDHPPQG